MPRRRRDQPGAPSRSVEVALSERKSHVAQRSDTLEVRLRIRLKADCSQRRHAT
jgi:hypothetical protein